MAPSAVSLVASIMLGSSLPVARLRVPVGILISSDGPYSVVSKSMLCGALLGIAEAQAEHRDLEIDPIIANPGGDNARYSAMAAEMLGSGIRHVVGCYTSSSRKEIIPLFEKADALLWYPSHYEGFESSSNVVYTGAVANQHLLPLVEYLLGYVGPKAFCVGSNYIWAWENNRILREAIGPNGGDGRRRALFPCRLHRVRPGHRCDPRCPAVVRLQHTDRRVLLSVPSRPPRRLREPGHRPGARDSGRKLHTVRAGTRGDRAGGGRRPHHVERLFLLARYAARTSGSSEPIAPGFPTVRSYRPTPRQPTSPCACSRARWRKRAPSRPAAVKRAVALRPIMAPQGEVRIDPETMHASLTPRIALFEPGRRLYHLARSDAAGARRSLPHPQFVTLRRSGHPARAAGGVMTTHRLIQNFRRSQGLLWASADFNADVLERTLLKLGVSLEAGRQRDSLGPRSRSRHRVSRRRSADQSRAALAARRATSPRRQ